MKAFTTIRVDLSERNDQLAKIMDAYNVLGVPTMVFFNKHGKQVPFNNEDEISVRSLQAMLNDLMS